jgi:phosphatidylserine/phosphatidylglycerophosphate/cardiolipin synthase-like enzyme/uncharacterized membrane protein YdjX (TVP38/TMEM64 family)
VILAEGRNCWKLARADRASFVVDAGAYFAAFREAVARASRSVVIIGWDVDSRVRLVPHASEHDRAPLELLPFLNHVLAAQPALRVFVLVWDFSVIYTLERELLPSYRFAWKGHPRLTFRLDDAHPLGASHHQKLVVIDDRVAFAGGVDLTIRRWDTPAHSARDPDRVDAAGVPYPPMHDVQMIVDGEAARTLGELARARWRAATGGPLPATPAPGDVDPWPTALEPEMRGVPVGISRTIPSLRPGGGDVREVLRLTLDAVAAARRSIYIESQYLTSAAVGEALARRLAEPDGPEVVAVLPREECGWLERRSMGIMRARLLRRLQEADRFSRLHVCHPTVPGLAPGCMNVHAKVMIIDDVLARVGSSNLSNRSMGLDTECDLVLDAGVEPRLRDAVVGLRDRLLAEHLGTSPDVVAGAVTTHGSLIRGIDALRGGPRSLEPLPPAAASPEAVLPGGTDAPINLAILDGLVCDPESPAPDLLLNDFVPGELRRPVHRSLLGWGLSLTALFALAAIWRLSPLPTLLNVDRMVALGRALRVHPSAPLLVLGGYLGAGLVLFPITLMLAATALVFDPLHALAYGLGGALASAAMTYGIGRIIGRHRPSWLSGPRVSRVTRQLQRRGTVAIVAARLLPVGNFSVINMVAGALGIRFRDFMLGNLVGLLPGILGLTIFADRLGRVLRNPAPLNVLAFVAVAAAVVGVFWWLRRRLARAHRPTKPAKGER